MSASTAQSEYASLLTSALPAVIRSEAENERYIAMLEKLDRRGSRMSAAARRMAELLTLLIEDFEEKHYALKAASPVEVLSELMLANQLKQKDLVDIFGTPSIVSEVLHGKRQLTTEHIRRLSRRFHVSPELFSKPPRTELDTTMTSEKKKRVTNAVGFLSGVLACMDAVRETRIFWPLDEFWEGLRHAQRVEFGAGVALIVVSIVLMSMRKRTQ
jgi:HTH-type transcriptional regulator/antitoxin HigA